jgi:hypothetical protein
MLWWPQLVLRFLIVLAVVAMVGCTRREGMNFECTWPSDPTFAVDLGGPGALRHLLDDIQLAEELGIRYGDQNSGRRVAVVFGIAVRLGGPVNVTLGRQLRETCTSSLFKTVAETHSISTEDIGRMRTRLSERGANLPVTVPMTLLYLWLSLYAIRRIRDRFEIDEALPVAVAVLLASIAVTAAVIMAAQLWGAGVEIVRVGNEHLSYRAGRRSWPRRAEVLPILALGVTSFSIMAAAQCYASPTISLEPSRDKRRSGPIA